jgi:hypothetical protein
MSRLEKFKVKTCIGLPLNLAVLLDIRLFIAK